MASGYGGLPLVGPLLKAWGVQTRAQLLALDLHEVAGRPGVGKRKLQVLRALRAQAEQETSPEPPLPDAAAPAPATPPPPHPHGALGLWALGRLRAPLLRVRLQKPFFHWEFARVLAEATGARSPTLPAVLLREYAEAAALRPTEEGTYAWAPAPTGGNAPPPLP
ncbi:MAG: hypothetical protein FJ086_04375 [Deltaproteobacteria bacterium]|nr:hypothetical protein [Deltaproteobacteria bacterium]